MRVENLVNFLNINKDIHQDIGEFFTLIFNYFEVNRNF